MNSFYAPNPMVSILLTCQLDFVQFSSISKNILILKIHVQIVDNTDF